MRDITFRGGGELPDPGGEAEALLDAHARVVAWGPGARRLLGRPARDVLGRRADELLHGTADAADLLRRWKEGARQASVRLRRRDGQPLDAEVWARPLTSVNGERQWLVQAAGARTFRTYEFGRALLKGLFTDTPFHIDLFDTRQRFIAQNLTERRAGVFRRTGYAGHTMREMAPPGLLDFDALEARQRQVLETGEALLGTEVDGHPVPGSPLEYVWSESILPLRDPSGTLIALAHVVSDVTKQVRSRERLVLANEAGARIGTSLDLWQTARELAEVAVPRFADVCRVDLLDSVFATGEPSEDGQPATPLLRRAAASGPDPGPAGAVTVPVGDLDTAATAPGSPFLEALEKGEPLLLADERLSACPDALRDGGPDVHSWLLVPMLARGAVLGTAVFMRSRTPRRFEPDDVLLAEQIVNRTAACVDNASRYHRERTTARTLRRSLLPQRLPSPSAVRTASSYQPASEHTGLGGDWFDVIPLSGTRVALVVGDVVGHGLQSAVVMGRLRGAVRTLADLDLSPGELLTHLDDQMNRALDERGDEVSLVTGATCLYAVYDPVSRRCRLARAGHPPLAVVSADGAVDFVDLAGGPPLGLGGVMFEEREIALDDGDLLVLYTDGLLESRTQDVDTGLRRLRGALSRTPASAAPQEVCDMLVRELLPPGHQDDVAVLVARVSGLAPDSYVTWEIETQDRMVGRARELTARQLASWGLAEESFTTELIVSELVTNALRYGGEPITLRLIRDRNLICEVSDGSSTSPHVRRAQDTDEGGRGLYLITQLAQNWGTRYGERGKTIWAEQPLSG
ncbi:serine phosphatase RsbU (regulator of sigma subunit) [Streptomyces sp. Ag109_O5-1]|uniref:SpoIIE family protein phosphatase n=1 Tax=Streptomyces sp. Ag109_O5-1 TaxID=1938851 RepID=UPI000F4E2669|nr:SpoIIE family protein phosphatase [Streptomyces sp. Ag109_O5-1]RPE37688.1 serine phosphatase RsbU (regulator of sigma subunit) [Streptomyces sp. Ag109_O5-1]